MADIKIGNFYAELSLINPKLASNKQQALKELKDLETQSERIMKNAGDKMTKEFKIELTKLEQNTNEAKKKLKEIENEANKISAAMERAGEVWVANISKPLLAFGQSSIDTFTQFEQSMQNTFSVMGATAGEMELLKQTAQKMGETTRFSASQAAEALYSLGSAGQSATEASKSLQGVLRLAGATGADLAYTSQTIASTLSQFNLQASKSSHVADVFAKAISKSQANITKLAYSMKYVGPVASGLGISLETTTAALMKLYNTGYGGEQAGTYLRQAFQKLASGTDDFKNKLAELGIAYEDVNPQTRNFADILNVLKNHNVGVTESIAIFGETAGGAMAKLIEEGGDAIRTFDGLLQASEGAAEEMQKIQNASFANTKAELSSAFEAVQISVGSILIPAIDVIAKGFTKILQAVNSLPIGIKTFITGLVVAAAALGPLLLLPKMIMAASKAMVALNAAIMGNPIFIAVAVIAAVAAAAYGLYNQIKANTQELADEAKRHMDELKESMRKAQEAAEKAQSLDSLISKYDTLKSKTNRTKEEQEEYNNTLTRLVELVPGVVTEIDATGNAYIANLEKIKQARNEQLLIEQQQITLAVRQAEQVEKADAILKEKLKTQQEKLEKKQSNNKNALEQAQETLEKMPELIERLRNAKSLREAGAIGGEAGMTTWDAMWNIFKLKNKVGEFLNEKAEKAQKTLEEKNKIDQAFIDIELRKVEKEQLLAKKALVEDMQKQRENQKAEDKSVVVQRALKEAQKSAEEVKNRATMAGKNQQQIKAEGLKEELRILDDYMLNIFRGMREGIELEKGFDWGLTSDGTAKDKDLKRVQERLKEIRRQLDTAKGGGNHSQKGDEKPQEKDKSLSEQLQAMDDLYTKRIELAKKYGKDELVIYSQWYGQRLELLQNAYNQELKTHEKAIQDELNVQEIAKAKRLKELNNEKLTEAERKSRELAIVEDFERQKAQIYKKYQNKVTNEVTDGKDADHTDGVTMADEFANTKKIFDVWKDQLTLAREEYRRKEEELKVTLEEIKNMQAMQGEGGKNLLLEQQIEACEQKAKRLAGELKVAYMTQKDLDELVASFQEKKNYGGVAGKIQDIRQISEDKKEAIKDIEAAFGKGTPKAMEAIKKINVASAKKIAGLVAQVIESVARITESLTNSIINAVETSKTGLEVSTKIASSFLGTLQDAIPEPITKAVLGTAQSVMNTVMAIVNYSARKEEERRKKTQEAREEAHKKELERAKEIAGDSAKEYAKHISAHFRSNSLSKNLIDAQFDKMLNKRVDDVLSKMGEAQTKLKKWVKSGYWDTKYNWGKARFDDVYVDTSHYELKTINELWEDYYNARKKGHTEEAKRIEQSIKYNQYEYLKKKGIREEDINGVYKYLGDIKSAYTQAIQAGDLSTIGVSFKEKIREAIVEKLKSKMFDEKLKKLINRYEKNPNEYNLNEVIEEAERAAKKYEAQLKDLSGALGVANSEMDDHIKAWSGMKKSITESLSSSLGDAAYNADWGAFKKAFASEMRKAIISAVLANANVKTKTQQLINNIMEDGKITEGEIDATIKQLQDVYDNVEGQLAGMAKITKALEGGIDVKNETNASIIQKLSGADRDWFTEVLREGFENMVKAFNFASVSFKEIHATQIIIQQATLSVSTVNIYARDNYSLKELIADMIKEAKANAG